MTRRDFTMLSGLIGVLALTACGQAGDQTQTTLLGGKVYPTYRYRLTVEVDTPEGLRTGSSVIEVQTLMAPKTGYAAIPSPGALSYKVHGEAVTVDLGARGVLFALLSSDTDGSDWAAGAFEMLGPQTSLEQFKTLDDDYGYRRAKALEMKGVLVIPRFLPDSEHEQHKPSDPPTTYPTLVRFRDIDDPRTIEKVDPDALAKSFEKGVALKRITVERTEDAVTTGIEKRLEWLPKQVGGLIATPRDMATDDMPFGALLTEGDFQRNF